MFFMVAVQDVVPVTVVSEPVTMVSVPTLQTLLLLPRPPKREGRGKALPR